MVDNSFYFLCPQQSFVNSILELSYGINFNIKLVENYLTVINDAVSVSCKTNHTTYSITVMISESKNNPKYDFI